MLEKLAKLANELDQMGLHSEADEDTSQPGQGKGQE
jgi:hypothetical protein